MFDGPKHDSGRAIFLKISTKLCLLLLNQLLKEKQHWLFLLKLVTVWIVLSLIKLEA